MLDSRRTYWQSLHSYWLFKMVGAMWAVLCVIELVLPFLPKGWGDSFYGLRYLPKWPWYSWVIGLLILTALALFESGHQQIEVLKSAGPDLWLGFSESAWGQENSPLCIQNRGNEPIFNVSVWIPEDGSQMKSVSIDRLNPDGQLVSCSVTKGQMADALDDAILDVPKIPKSFPIRINYTDLRGMSRHSDRLEVRLPFRSSSIGAREQR